MRLIVTAVLVLLLSLAGNPLLAPPLTEEPVWTAEGDQAGEWFGGTVSHAGDVNGDGHDDLIVSADSYDAAEENEGRVLVYYGSVGGLPPGPSWTAVGEQAHARFGKATACNVNGDGYDDVIVSAYKYTNTETEQGKIYLFTGSPTGLSHNPIWTAEGDQASSLFGWSLACAGDVNGDGYADVVVGASNYDNGEVDEGRAFLYLGTASGLEEAPAWTAESDQAGAYFGDSVASAGDVNGDGYDDLIVGTYRYDNNKAVFPESNVGKAYVYFGSPTGLPQSPDWTEEGAGEDAHFAKQVTSAGDVNGDGYNDVIIGAGLYYSGDDFQRAYLYVGSAGGLSDDPAWVGVPEEPSSLGDYFYNLASAGDVDGDGHDDIIVGDPDSSVPWGVSGNNSARLYRGVQSGLTIVPVWTVHSTQEGGWFASSVAFAGDLNGDGADDVVIGAPGHLNDMQVATGRAYVYYGVLSTADDDGDGYTPAVGDCDDTDDNTFPGAAPNDSTTECMKDADHDDWGDDDPPSGVVAGTDCDDDDPNSYPGAAELCDHADNQCPDDTGHGMVDEGFPALGLPCYVGVGACLTAGYNLCTADGLGTECDAVPGTPTPEICDELDNDCDGFTDMDDPEGIDDDTVDSDNDGLANCEELDLVNEILSINALGADWQIPDIFVEVDYMSCDVDGDQVPDPGCTDLHDHRPREEALRNVEQAFARDRNHDGQPDLALHLMVSEDPVSHEVFGCSNHAACASHWMTLVFGIDSGRDPAVICNPASEVLFADPEDRADQLNCIDIVTAKTWVFRHLLIAHNYPPDLIVGRALSEQDGHVWYASSVYDSEFPAAAERVFHKWEDDLSLSIDDEILVGFEGTVMHELGHTLGLGHGGGDSINCKPNYLSVMSNSRIFNTAGLASNIPGVADGDPVRIDRELDYATFLTPLVESVLFEETASWDHRISEQSFNMND